MSGIIINSEPEKEENDLRAFLTKVSLEEKLENFQSNGLKRIEHLQDIQEKDIGVLGLTVFEWRRLQREITTWNTKGKEKTANTQRNGAAFRTSSASTIVSLPKAFKNFFQTRDGQGNVVVSIEALKKKFKNLWYENPVNPTQMFSNSFILQMAEQRLQYEKTHRGCELWCRNQRSKRIYFLLAAAKRPAINTWNHYYKNQSIMGKCEIVDDQFRAVASFLEANGDSSAVPPKPMYEMVCQYVGKLEEVSTFSTTVLQKCDAEVAEFMTDDGLKRGYKDELAFLSEEARPILQETDQVIKTKLQQARDCMKAAREKYGYSTSFKSAKHKRQKGKKSASEPSTSQTDSVTVVDSESECEDDS